MKIVHLPDIHLGHSLVSADKIHSHMIKVVYPKLDKNIDIVIIGGDFFDTLLDMDSKAGFHTNTIILELKNLAIVNDFKIRVLRGTFSHDRHQNQFFETEGSEKTDRVKVFNKPSVEYFEDLKVWILYKPDDLPYDDVWDKMKELLEKNQVNKVDIFINHGYFDHMLPSYIPIKPHGILDYEKVKSVVIGPILNGHVHTPSVHDRCISGGSFERLKHGEEENKGFFIINYSPETSHMTYEFINNEYTPLFRTFKPSEHDPIESFKDWINRMQVGNAEDVHIRVISSDKSFKSAYERILKNLLPKSFLKFENEKNNTLDTDSMKIEKVELPKLTPDNIFIKLNEYINSKFDKNLSVDQIENILTSEVI